MRVTCPACSAAYEVPEAKIGTGRKLRCARCQHDWWVEPPPATPAAEEGPFGRAVAQAAPALAPAPPPAPEPAPPPPIPPAVRPAPAREPPLAAGPPPQARAAPPAAAEAPTGGGMSLTIAWAATALVVLGCSAAVLLYPVPIIEAWPPAERLYIALGMVPGR